MTMSCDRWRDPIADVAAGEPVTPALEAHLGICSACQQALLDEQALHARIVGELRQALRVAPSPNLLPLVREQISRARVRWVSLLLPAAAGLALLVFGVDPWRRSPDAARDARSVEAPQPSPPLPQAPLTLPSDAPRRPPVPALERRSASRAPLRVDLPDFGDASIRPIPDAEPVRPAALVIAPLDALPPIEPRPLVTVGLDSEGAER